jgi:two-component system, OmpR family, phosphate regulon sensor histidine kinase PhoR
MNKKLLASFRISIGIAAATLLVTILLEHFIFGIHFSAKWFVLHFALLIVILECSWMILEVFVFRKIRSISDKISSQLTTNNKQQTTNLLVSLGQNVDALTVERKDEIERLQKLETYRKELLGNVSHELKTPIFNIQGYIHTLLDGGIDDKNINRDYLQRAGKSVDRMIAIVEDLQTITQLEKGELELDEERFDAVALAKDVIDSQELKAKETGIFLELVNDESQPVYVYADRFRIRQVLVNLVVNSVRYGKQNGKTSVRLSDTGEKIIVEVADNGIGISKEHLPRIFERFYRADKSRSREHGGTGLGLSIVKHIIEAHGQTIDVLSTEGAGSVFSFTLKKG